MAITQSLASFIDYSVFNNFININMPVIVALSMTRSRVPGKW